MAEIVNGVFLAGESVLLGRRSRHRRQYPDSWSFPGDHFDDGESVGWALARELGEEIGVLPLDIRLLRSIAVRAPTAATFHVFAVTRWPGEPAIRDAEHSELRWFPIARAAKLTDLALVECAAMLRALLPCR